MNVNIPCFWGVGVDAGCVAMETEKENGENVSFPCGSCLPGPRILGIGCGGRREEAPVAVPVGKQ